MTPSALSLLPVPTRRLDARSAWRRWSLTRLRWFCPLGLLAIGLVAGGPGWAAPIDGAEAVAQSESAASAAAAAQGAWVQEALSPKAPGQRTDADPLQLAPGHDGPSLPEPSASGTEQQPSASVRSLSEGLPMQPAFPGHGLSFEPQPQVDRELPEPADGAGGRAPGASGDGLREAGKGWLMENASRDQIQQLKEARVWLATYRVPVTMAAAALALAVAAWAMLRNDSRTPRTADAEPPAESRRHRRRRSHRGSSRSGSRSAPVSRMESDWPDTVPMPRPGEAEPSAQDLAAAPVAQPEPARESRRWPSSGTGGRRRRSRRDRERVV